MLDTAGPPRHAPMSGSQFPQGSFGGLGIHTFAPPGYDGAGAQSLGFSLVYLGLRYDVELIHRIPYWPAPTDRNNVDPRIGFAWDPMGDQKWSVRGGLGAFTQQNPIFTILKGAVQRRYGIVQLSLPAGDPNFPVFPNALPGFPPGAVLPARNIQEISPDLENERGWQYSLGFQRQLGNDRASPWTRASTVPPSTVSSTSTSRRRSRRM